MPTRSEIKPKVVHVLAAVAVRSESSIKETQSLDGDLGLGGYVRAALAVPFTKISRTFPNGKSITIDEARGLKTVTVAIDLVFSRANGGSS